MEKYLIINADDFGMSHASNLAVQELLTAGGITSSTIMPPCAWSYEAARFANENPTLGIGVHLTLTSEWGTYRWSPVTGTGSSLCDETGVFMHKTSSAFETHASYEETQKELRAQVAKMHALGLRSPSHLDNHMGSLYGIEEGHIEFLQLAFELASEMHLPFRLPKSFTPAQFSNTMLGIKISPELVNQMLGKFTSYALEHDVCLPDYLIPGDWSGPQKDSYENYREYIYELYRTFPDGVTETYIHPAVESPELKAITGNWEKRVWEYRLFRDPKTKQHIESLGIQLINYRDLQRMRTNG